MEKTVQEIITGARGSSRRLELPGNPRYQPKSLIPFFGHDNLVKFLIEVEWALWKALAKIGIIPVDAAALLTDELRQQLLEEITTTLQDTVEREITKHDIRALIKIIHELVVFLLSKYTHLTGTSYDIIDTARIIAYKRAFWSVSFPTLLKLISSLSGKAREFADVVQIGRTHGQHAEPITVGFWLATVLARMINIAEHLIDRETELVGKFSGAVGAYNSQVAFGFEEKAQQMFGKTFEELVLAELGLLPAAISTQILPPEPLARFLFEYTLLSGALAQLSLDCRNLQRAEIAEIGEPFGETQDGSSAMPHKRNPITHENTQGMEIIVKHEFGKVLDALFSEHQRDLTTSAVMREFPGIVVFTQYQLENLNRVIPRISTDRKALQRNLDMNKHLILSEAVCIALVLAGYSGDAHSLVNHTLVPRSQASRRYLIDELQLLAKENPELRPVVDNIPSDLIKLLRSPEDFTGKAREKALEIISRADSFLEKYSTKGGIS